MTTIPAARWSRRDRAIAYTYVAGQAALLAVVFSPVSAASSPASTPSTPAPVPPTPASTAFSPACRRSRPRTGWAASALALGPGAALAAVGMATLGRELTALPLPTDNAVLRTTGVYARVRHPIYTGVMLASLARAAATRSPARLAAAGLLVGLLNAKATWEERHLAERFPGYAAYARRTPRFLPRLRGVPARRST